MVSVTLYTLAKQDWQLMSSLPPPHVEITITIITIYFIFIPVGKLKVSFDRIH